MQTSNQFVRRVLIGINSLLICVVQSTTLKFVPSLKKPDFCNKLDCPSYTVKKSTVDYELRYYYRTHWVSDVTKGVSFKDAQEANFRKLFDYIQGKNDQKKKIAMTAPVLTKIIPGPGPACENDFTMSFYVSASVKVPPKPTDTSVYLTGNNTMDVYVRSFGGYVHRIDTWLKEAEKLAESLERSGVDYIKDYYFIAGYNSPFQLFKRHNEIWFLAK